MPNNNFKIAKDIVASYEARINVVQAIVEDTRKLLEEFRNRREKMSQGLREALSEHESLRKKDFDKMMGDIVGLQSWREENVKTMLADFEDKELQVLGSLKAMLQKGEKLRLKDFKVTLANIRMGQEIREKETSSRVGEEVLRMKSEVQEMLANFKTEREKASTEWKNMVTLMSKKRKQKQTP